MVLHAGIGTEDMYSVFPLTLIDTCSMKTE